MVGLMRRQSCDGERALLEHHPSKIGDDGVITPIASRGVLVQVAPHRPSERKGAVERLFERSAERA